MSEKKREPNRRVDMRGASEHSGRSVGTIRNWISSGDHPKYEKEFNGRIYFWTHDIDAWLQAKKEVVEANVRGWNVRRAG